ncbi:MAG TPA: FAD/NAD(P)-binding protein [Solirubrobacterales bacterium]|nr:FAD/NAD(P)-binding protein [Solirubrobacterales bacterium]
MPAPPEGTARPAAESVGWPAPGDAPARDPMLPSAYLVTSKRQELDDTWTLVLEPADGAAVGEFGPGQFSLLYAFGSGEVPISLSGGGARGEPLVHTVRAVGAATRAICAAEPGEMLGVRGPFGTSWPLEAAAGGDVVVVTGGIGLAPLRLAIERLVAGREQFGSVSLLYGARNPAEMLYPSELDAWGDAGIEVATTVDSAPSGWKGRVGLVTTLIPEASFDGPRTTAFVCGPEVMMRFVSRALRDRGVPASRIHLSLERNMKCAIGHCGHCQLAREFVCKDGAVFPLDRIEPLLGIREL